MGHAKSTGKAILIDSSGEKGKNWRIAVKWSAREAMKMHRQFPPGIPIHLEIIFRMPRPKSHFRANGTMKPTAPFFHIVKPDATKMLRAVEDALTGIVWHDDAQVAYQWVAKRYCSEGQEPGAQITIYQIAQ